MSNSRMSSKFRWIRNDLKRSGLKKGQINVIPIQNEEQIENYLGYTSIKKKRLVDLEGYLIPYPGIKDFARLKLKEPIEKAKYLAPKGKGNRAYIRQEVRDIAYSYKPDAPIFFTEGEKKAAKATSEGFMTVGVSGIFSFFSKGKLIRDIARMNLKHRICYIAYDNDIDTNMNVKQAELRLCVELINKSAFPVCFRIPNKDGQKMGLDDYLVQYGKDELTLVMSELKDRDLKQPFELHLKENTPLDLIYKEISSINDHSKLEEIMGLIAKTKKIGIKPMRQKIKSYKMLRIKKESVKKPETYTEIEVGKAKQILKSPDLLDQFSKLLTQSGYVGEELNKKLAYLACTSRKLSGKGKAISLIAQGDSGSGKSELVKRILELMPKNEYRELTLITEKALYHTKQDLSHSILAVLERQGGEYANYTIRTALSEEKISIMIPIKNENTGDFETHLKEVPAEGMVYIETTTEHNIEAQNSNRTFEFFTDSSSEHTRNILKSKAKSYKRNSKKFEKRFRIWRCIQNLLKSLPVHLPFADKLALQFPDQQVRARRDFPRLLNLIEASALLHQYQRKRKKILGEERIIASVEDFNIAYSIVKPVLTQTYKQLSPKAEMLMVIVKEEIGLGNFSENYDQFNPNLTQGKNIFSMKVLKEIIKRRVKKNNNDIAKEFLSTSTLAVYMKQLQAKKIIEWNGKKGVASKHVLVSDTENIEFNISLE